MSKANKKEIAEQIKTLREWIKPGDTVYTVCEHVSKSGMRRVIRVVVPIVHEGKIQFVHPNYGVSVVAGYTLSKRPHNGLIVHGCGMDMGFDLIYNLSYALYGKGDAIKQAWL